MEEKPRICKDGSLGWELIINGRYYPFFRFSATCCAASHHVRNGWLPPAPRPTDYNPSELTELYALWQSTKNELGQEKMAILKEALLNAQ